MNRASSDLPESIEPQTGLLVQHARKGSGEAMSALLGRYHPRVLRIVRRRLGDRLRAELDSQDVVQDAMMEVVRSIHDFTPRSDRAFLRWVAAVVENRIRNLARSQRPHLREELPSSIEPPASATDEVDALVLEEERTRLAQALDSLSEEFRRVIHLRYYARLGFAEIGEELGRTERASSALHARAKIALAQAMRSSDSQRG